MSISVLNLYMAGDNQAGASTVRDYLKALLLRLWDEGEGFSGKRPFGNSGWEYDLYYTLVKNNFVSGYINDYGEVESVDSYAANQLIFSAIRAL